MPTPSTAELSNISAPRDEQITPDDLLGDEKVYAALSDRLRIFLESIDDDTKRKPFLFSVLETIHSKRTEGIDQINQSLVQVFIAAGLPKGSVSQLLNKTFDGWIRNSYSPAPLISDTVLNSLHTSTLLTSDRQIPIVDLLTTANPDRTLLTACLDMCATAYYLKNVTHDTQVIRDFAINQYLWEYSQRFSEDLVANKIKLKQLPDEYFVKSVLSLKIFGFLDGGNPLSRTILSRIANHVSSSHPEFMQRLKLEASGEAYDSERLIKLKRFYGDVFAIKWHLHALQENQGAGAPLSKNLIHNAANESGSGGLVLDKLRRAYTGGSAVSTQDADATNIRESHLGILRMKLALAFRQIRLKQDELCRMYGLEQSCLKSTDTVSNQLIIDSFIAVLTQQTELDETIIDNLYNQLDTVVSLELFDPTTSKVELVALVGYLASRFINPDEKKHYLYLELFQNKFLPYFSEHHDLLPSPDPSSVQNSRQPVTYQTAKSDAIQRVSRFTAQQHAICGEKHPDIQDLRKRWYDQLEEVSKKLRLLSISVLRRESFYPFYKTEAIIISVLMGILSLFVGYVGVDQHLLETETYSKTFATFFESFANAIAAISSDKEFVASDMISQLYVVLLYVALLVLPVGTTWLAASQHYADKLGSELARLSVTREKHATEFEKKKTDLIKKTIQTCLSLTLVSLGTFSIGAGHQQIFDLAEYLYTAAKEQVEAFNSSKTGDMFAQNDESFSVSNSSEVPKLGEGKFTAYGVSNYPDLFWLGNVCDLIEHGEQEPTMYCFDMKKAANKQELPAEYAETDFFHLDVYAFDRYTDEESRLRLTQAEVSQGNIVRFNDNNRDLFYEIPSGFRPTKLIVSYEDAGIIVNSYTSWFPGAGLYIKPSIEGDEKRFQDVLGVVYEPFTFLSQEQIIQQNITAIEAAQNLPVVTELNGQQIPGFNRLPIFGSPKVMDFIAVYSSEERSMDFTTVESFFSDNSWYFTEKETTQYLQSLDLDNYVLTAFTVSDTLLSRLRSLEGILLSPELANNLALTEEFERVSASWKFKVLRGGELSSAFSIIIPKEKYAESSELLKKLIQAYIASDATTPFSFIFSDWEAPNWSDGTKTSLLPNLQDDPYFYTFITDDGKPDYTIVSKSLQTNSRFGWFNSSKVRMFSGDRTKLPTHMKQIVDVAESQQPNDQIKQIVLLVKLYREMGVNYGFQAFSLPAETPLTERFVALTALDEHGRPIHDEQICNQSSFVDYTLADQIEGQHVALGGGFVQSPKTTRGGYGSTAHQLIIAKNLQGYMQIVDATLPDTDNDVIDYPRPPDQPDIDEILAKNEIAHSLEDIDTEKSVADYPYVVLALATGLSLLLVTNSEKISKKLRSRKTERNTRNDISRSLEKRLMKMEPSTQTALAYALMACAGISDLDFLSQRTVSGNFRIYDKVKDQDRGYPAAGSSLALESLRRVLELKIPNPEEINQQIRQTYSEGQFLPAQNWAEQSNRNNQVVEYILDILESSGSILVDSQLLSEKIAPLALLLRQQEIGSPRRFPALARSFFERRFSSHLAFEDTTQTNIQRVLLNIRTLAIELEKTPLKNSAPPETESFSDPERMRFWNKLRLKEDERKKLVKTLRYIHDLALK